jgi:hypothetical protein
MKRHKLLWMNWSGLKMNYNRMFIKICQTLSVFACSKTRAEISACKRVEFPFLANFKILPKLQFLGIFLISKYWDFL